MKKRAVFSQVAVDNGVLYALDNSGRVWVYDGVPQAWRLLGNPEEPKEDKIV